MTPDQIQFCTHVEQGEVALAQALLTQHANLLFQTDDEGMNPVLYCMQLRQRVTTSSAAAAADLSSIRETFKELILPQLTKEKLQGLFQYIETYIQSIEGKREITDAMRAWIKTAIFFLEKVSTGAEPDLFTKHYQLSQALSTFSIRDSKTDPNQLLKKMDGLSLENNARRYKPAAAAAAAAAATAVSDSGTPPSTELLFSSTRSRSMSDPNVRGRRRGSRIGNSPHTPSPLRNAHSDESMQKSEESSNSPKPL